MLWTRNGGTPAMLNGPSAPCGSIHPLGIIGTPVNGDTGQPVYTGTEPCGVVQKWTSPIAVRGRIIVGATGRLCASSAP